MLSLSRRPSALHLLPLSVLIFDTATSTTLALDDLENPKNQPKKTNLITQSSNKKKSFEVGKVEMMKLYRTARAYISETATDKEIIDAVLEAVDIMKKFGGGIVNFSLAEVEAHIQQAKNKRLLRQSLSARFETFSDSFHFAFDLKSLKAGLDKIAPKAKRVVIPADMVEEDKENKSNIFSRKSNTDISLYTANSKTPKKPRIKQNEDTQERSLSRIPLRLILSNQAQFLSEAINHVRETGKIKIKSMMSTTFGGDNNSGGSNSSGNLTHSNSPSSMLPFWLYEANGAFKEISLDNLSEGKAAHSFVSPYFLSYYQFPGFNVEMPRKEPKTLIDRTWVTISQFWKYYPELCLMIGMGLLAAFNAFVSQFSHTRRRFSYNLPGLRTVKIKK